jgi:hypothetical protein
VYSQQPDPLVPSMLAGQVACAQKYGGVLKMSYFESPASMSLHEKATAAANRPIIGVFPRSRSARVGVSEADVFPRKSNYGPIKSPLAAQASAIASCTDAGSASPICCSDKPFDTNWINAHSQIG